MSPDPYDGSYDANNPQSLNRYSFVLNDSLVYDDPDGTSDDDCPSYTCDSITVTTSPPAPVPITPPAGLPPMIQPGPVGGLGSTGSGTGGSGGGNAPKNGTKPCSVLTTPCQKSSKLLKHVTFLGCEFNKDIEQLTDEEDAQHVSQIPIVFSAIATVGGLTGKIPGWAGITGAVTGGVYTIDIAVKSNQVCTEYVYGH